MLVMVGPYFSTSSKNARNPGQQQRAAGRPGRKERTFPDLGEVVRLHADTRATVDSGLVANDLGAERLREAADRLA